jgi:hypothetical protein
MMMRYTLTGLLSLISGVDIHGKKRTNHVERMLLNGNNISMVSESAK